ncbi:copper amine oxidase domain protein [Ammonifex degensii KC4]|uniref:Copper amine oxidase domain protein n=1 Tax=Ammonifex degensii (strain DSM 10501 / KC4) TaxID=429009 RepID=C9RCC5_AMMDK|nr:stalk domain-containing protein [Ammonifex degensii]ACX51902.1 copper amine oxidase domain protein [Ammonifex degensii KC4]
MKKFKVLSLAVLVVFLLAGSVFGAVKCLAQEEKVVTDQGWVVFRLGDPRVFVKGPNADKFAPEVPRRPADGAPDVTVLKIDVAPYTNKDGRTMVPFRFLANALGVDNRCIHWDGALRQVTLDDPAFPTVQMIVGERVIATGGREIPIDTAPELVSPPGRTTLPARFVAQALGYNVEWDEKTNTVYCWKGQRPKEQVRDEILKLLGGELAWRSIGVSTANKVLAPPGGHIVPGNGAYSVNGVMVIDESDGVVCILTTVGIQPKATLPDGTTWEQQMATLRQVLERNFGPGEFTEKLMYMAEQKDSQYKNYPPLQVLTAPDGRQVMVDDDGGGIFIAVKPPGVGF